MEKRIPKVCPYVLHPHFISLAHFHSIIWLLRLDLFSLLIFPAPSSPASRKSEKYSHVTSKLDTGMTVDKVKVVSASEYSRRRDETFYRVTRGQLYELYTEYEAEDHETITETDYEEGNGPRIVTHSETSSAQYNKPYLILDVREQEAYQECHLVQARSYPSTMMRRDFTHPEIYHFKNKPETLIIVYCDDERISREAAHVLVGRGIDNVFLLTGGLLEFAERFPPYVEGNLPELPSNPSRGAAKSGGQQEMFVLFCFNFFSQYSSSFFALLLLFLKRRRTHKQTEHRKIERQRHTICAVLGTYLVKLTKVRLVGLAPAGNWPGVTAGRLSVRLWNVSRLERFSCRIHNISGGVKKREVLNRLNSAVMIWWHCTMI